jgi:hypothetical protein
MATTFTLCAQVIFQAGLRADLGLAGDGWETRAKEVTLPSRFYNITRNIETVLSE